MTLQEIETKLSKLNEKIDKLLKEREDVLKEWNIAFDAENIQNIVCIDENINDNYKIYLVNGEVKMLVCYFSNWDIKGSINDFYRKIDNSIGILHIVNRREFELPEYQRNLVYAKAIEIRERILVKEGSL